MIQRIQTIFLLLASGALGGLAGLPFITASAQGSSSGYFSDQHFNIFDHTGLLVCFGLAALLGLLAIFLFKNRKIQMRITLLALLAIIAGIGFGVYLLFQFNGFQMDGLNISLGSLLPVIAILFLILAHRNIKKDEKTVKSAYSRLRD